MINNSRRQGTVVASRYPQGRKALFTTPFHVGLARLHNIVVSRLPRSLRSAAHPAPMDGGLKTCMPFVASYSFASGRYGLLWRYIRYCTATCVRCMHGSWVSYHIISSACSAIGRPVRHEVPVMHASVRRLASCHPWIVWRHGVLHTPPAARDTYRNEASRKLRTRPVARRRGRT